MRNIVCICAVLTLGCVLNVDAALMRDADIDKLTSETTYRSQLTEALDELQKSGGSSQEINTINRFWVNTTEPRWIEEDKYCHKRFVKKFKDTLKYINKRIRELKAEKKQAKTKYLMDLVKKSSQKSKETVLIDRVLANLKESGRANLKESGVVNSSNENFEQRANQSKQVTINGEKVSYIDNTFMPTNLTNFKTESVDDKQWFKDLFNKSVALDEGWGSGAEAWDSVANTWKSVAEQYKICFLIYEREGDQFVKFYKFGKTGDKEMRLIFTVDEQGKPQYLELVRDQSNS